MVHYLCFTQMQTNSIIQEIALPTCTQYNRYTLTELVTCTTSKNLDRLHKFPSETMFPPSHSPQYSRSLPLIASP